MDKKVIDNIVWWIPIKKLRNQFRNILLDLYNKISDLYSKIDAFNEYMALCNNDRNILNNRVSNLESQQSADIVFKNTRIRDLYLRYMINTLDFEHKKWFIIKEASFHLRYTINLDNPRTLNEKINWLKLYYNNPILTKIEDKVLFKEYIKEQLGDGYTIPLLGTWDNVETVDFDKLPNQFVLKSNVGSDSSCMISVKDKSQLDINEAKLKMYDWLNPVFSVDSVFFKILLKKPKLLILAEEYKAEIETNRDFKFICSYGKIIFGYNTSYINTNGEHHIYYNFFDENYNIIDIVYASKFDPIKPYRFDEMVSMSKQLSKNFPLVRIDFYDLKEALLLGEFTFYPVGGHIYFKSIEYDKQFGDMVDLTKIPKEHLLKECQNSF